MGSMCSRGHSRGHGGHPRDAASAQAQAARANMLANPRAYFDALYGPSDGPAPSPYHPLATQPVRVPTLFELALEQLCVSLVDRHSLEALLESQQRVRRSSLRTTHTMDQENETEGMDGADGSGTLAGVSTPTTPLAAAVWATTPLLKGAAGATRRYSHADALQHAHLQQQAQWSTPKSKQGKGSSVPGSPYCFTYAPFSPSAVAGGARGMGSAAASSGVSVVASPTAAPATVVAPAAVSPAPLKRARSLSLSSKESPELQPQIYTHTPGSALSASHRMPVSAHASPIAAAASAHRPLQRSFSSAGSSPLHQSFGSTVTAGGPSSVPCSPLILGASSVPATPAAASSAAQWPPHAMPPPLQRMMTDPPGSMPTFPVHGGSDPPHLSLPGPLDAAPSASVGHSSLLNWGAAGGVAHLVTEGEDGTEMDEPEFTLPAAGSSSPSQQQHQAQRLLRLPDSIVQLIFDRMVSEELLTPHNIRLFATARGGLQRIDFSPRGAPPESTDINGANLYANHKYGRELTDEQMHVLFEGVVRQYNLLQHRWQMEQDERARARSRLPPMSLPTTPQQQQQRFASAAPMSSPTSPLLGATAPAATTQTVSPPVASHPNLGGGFLVRASPPSEAADSVSLVSASTTAAAASMSISASPSSTSPPVLGFLGPTLGGGSSTSPPVVDATVPASALAGGSSSPPVVAAPRKSSIDSPLPANLTLSATSSPRMLAQTSTPHHGSIAHLSLERQGSRVLQQQQQQQHLQEQFSLGEAAVPGSPAGSGLSTPVHAQRGLSTPASAPPPSRSLADSFGGSTRLSPALPPPTLHNPLSITSPSPSLALYAHAPSLTELNLSGCAQLTNRALMPLQLCLLLRILNLNHVTQLSDPLLICVLPNKFLMEELQIKGLRGVTDATLAVMADKTRMRRLDVDSTAVTDAGLSQLAALTNLEHLSCGWNGRRVSEKGLSWVSQCFRMHTLCVASTAVSNTGFFANLRLLREVNLAGLKMTDGGLKQPAAFPHLRHAYVQRTQLREVPLALLHYHLHTLDLSFSSDVTAGKLLRQFTEWAAAKPPNLSVAPPPAPAASEHEDMLQVGSSSLSASGAAGSVLSTMGDNAGGEDASVSPDWLASMSTVSSVAAAASSRPVGVTHSIPLLKGSDPSCIQVRRLGLESCCVSNRLAALIGAHMLNLTELNLTDTDVGGDGLAALHPLKELRVLHVSGCKVTNASLSVLKHFKRLRELYLDCPTISDGGLVFLRPLAPTLQRLDVFEAAVGDQGMELLDEFRALLSLECCSGRLSNKGLSRIASSMPSLTSLNVSQNVRIDDAGVEVLRRLTKLVHVNLSGTGVTHKGLAFLSDDSGALGLGAHGVGAAAKAKSGSTRGDGLVGLGLVTPMPALQRISLFGCDVKITSAKLAQLPPGVQIGIDSGVLRTE